MGAFILVGMRDVCFRPWWGAGTEAFDSIAIGLGYRAPDDEVAPVSQLLVSGVLSPAVLLTADRTPAVGELETKRSSYAKCAEAGRLRKKGVDFCSHA